jgi:hypothetical protein
MRQKTPDIASFSKMGNGAVGFRSGTPLAFRLFYMNLVPGLQNQAADAAPSGELSAAVPGRLAGLLWTTLVGLLAAALCAPFIRSVFWLGDEGVLLAGAERMLHGSRLYADFFEFLPPGGFVIAAAWLGIAGISMWSARILAILTIAGIACFTYLACRAACRHAFYPALVVIGWVVMTQGYWTEVSHHWFTTLLSMIAAWAALRNPDHRERSLWEPLIAGLAGGAAAMVVPPRGALAMIAGAVSFAGSRGSRQQLIMYVLASAVVPAGLFAYVIATHSLTAAFDDVILFTASRYASIQGVPFGYFADLQNFLLKYFFPIVALLTLLTFAHDWPACLHRRPLRSCAAFGLAGFLGCFPRPDIGHIAFAVPLACPLLVYCSKCLSAGSLRRYRPAAAVLAVVLCVPSGFAYWQISQGALRAPTVPTARGNVAFLDNVQGAGALAAQIAATPADDAYFFYPLMSLMSFLTGRGQVSRYDVFTPGYTLPSQYRQACIAATRHASWVVIDRNWTDPGFLKSIFPALRNPERAETAQFEQALKTGFGLVGVYGPFELRRREPGADQIDCARIAG